MKEFMKYIKELNILYVEDDLSTQEELAFFLEQHVAQLHVANNGQEALDLYKSHDIDLVLSDINMPVMDGITLASEIREINENAKIVLLTAYNDTEFLLKAIQANVDNYLQKPIDLSQMMNTIGKLSKTIFLSKENEALNNTIVQYKSIVDERSIVSKTTKNGIITYVNKPFEEISGYSKEELLGQNHNIVRHEDMPKEVFKDMWRTILNKKVWQGIIKNRKKDGGYYYVDTVIKPILDIHGEIEEFIALRNDVTSLEDARQYFEELNHQSSTDLKEAMRLSKLYEKAIDKANIILKLSTDLTITYANDAFYNISGYTNEDLIGKPYSVIKDPSIPQSIYEQRIENLVAHLQKGKSYCNEVSNIAKDGSIFHCKYRVFPIKDAQGNIVEYFSIRQDVTQIVQLHEELEDTQRELIYRLGEVGETRSKETGNHVKRVAEYSKLLAQKVGLEDKEVDLVFSASPMHDIGKVGIPDEVLNKPGKLSAEEWVIMRTHCDIGYDILKYSNRPILKAAAIIAKTHHEKWNGSGYPEGLKEEEIHIFGRITAIADVFDALGSDRVYKQAWELEKILEFFQNQKGKHFEPRLIDILFDNLDDFLYIRDKYKDEYIID